MPRKPIFTVETPVPEARVVTLYEDTWDEHIIVFHPEMQGRIQIVEQTLVVPTFVCEGNRPDSFLFINDELDGAPTRPLVVVVGGHSVTGELTVNSAYPGRKTHADKSRQKVRWPKK